MKFKSRYLLIPVIIILFSIIAIRELNILPIHPKPEAEPQQPYDYYIILDEMDGHSLMYVPLIVNVGDEVLTDENKRYKVVKIEENRAIARFVENVSLEKYKAK